MATIPRACGSGRTQSRHRRAVKVWDERQFRNLADDVEVGTRNLKLALRKLRRFARTGAADELDLDDDHPRHRPQCRPARPAAAPGAAQRGQGADVLRRRRLDGRSRPLVEELFSAARSEFKHLEYYYFHNCLYEWVWRDNRRRFDERIPTLELLHTFGADYKVVFVGDATMSPYELVQVGGANEHWNEEPAPSGWRGCARPGARRSGSTRSPRLVGRPPVDPDRAAAVRGADVSDDDRRARARECRSPGWVA